MKKKYDITRESLEEWMLGSPSDQVNPADLDSTEQALINFANEHAILPPPNLKSKILEAISGLNALKNKGESYTLENLPLLTENPNWAAWQNAVANIAPPEDYENIHMHPLDSNSTRELFVIWVKDYVPEEVHHDILESFVLLEGSCICHITDKQGNSRTVNLSQGGFIEMKIGETHDIRITSLTPAKAILQWKKLAA